MAAAPSVALLHDDPNPPLFGFLAGLAAAVTWSSYFAMSRVGVLGGLGPAELMVLRFAGVCLMAVPCFLFLPGWRLRDLAGVGWLRSLALAAFVGPLYMLLAGTAFTLAPLAHGAVIQPSTAATMTLLLSIVLLRERPRPMQIAGTGVIVSGIVIIVVGEAGAGTAGPNAWIGDVLFFTVGTLWAIFTMLLRHWRLDGLRATMAFSLVSGLIGLPGYALIVGTHPLTEISLSMLLSQLVVQGLLAGGIAIILFGKAVTALGAGKAGVFPALVPALALLVGIPVAGEIPTTVQLLGLGAVSLGLPLALGLVRRRR